MADNPTTPDKHSRTRRPGIANADVPSDTAGLPGIGEGASATQFARDLPEHLQQGEGDETGDRAPADPRDRVD